MKQDVFSKWLKLMIVGVGICGFIVYGGVIPMLGEAMVDRYPEFGYCRLPWLILILATAIPCYIALTLAWKIAVNIGEDRSFSIANGKLLKWISVLAAGDTAFFFAGNLIFLLLGMNHPGIVLGALLIEFLGVATSVASAALSRLVMKAAELQDQSDLTI